MGPSIGTGTVPPLVLELALHWYWNCWVRFINVVCTCHKHVVQYLFIPWLSLLKKKVLWVIMKAPRQNVERQLVLCAEQPGVHPPGWPHCGVQQGLPVLHHHSSAQPALPPWSVCQGRHALSHLLPHCVPELSNCDSRPTGMVTNCPGKT